MNHIIRSSSVQIRSRVSLMGAAVRVSCNPIAPPFQSAAASLGGTPRARVPLIKFIGKRSKTAHISESSHGRGPFDHSKSMAMPSVVEMSEDIFALKDGAWHGRPKLSPSEIEAIISGGASSL